MDMTVRARGFLMTVLGDGDPTSGLWTRDCLSLGSQDNAHVLCPVTIPDKNTQPTKDRIVPKTEHRTLPLLPYSPPSKKRDSSGGWGRVGEGMGVPLDYEISKMNKTSLTKQV